MHNEKINVLAPTRPIYLLPFTYLTKEINISIFYFISTKVRLGFINAEPVNIPKYNYFHDQLMQILYFYINYQLMRFYGQNNCVIMNNPLLR